jgi:precorrin-2 C(20)-methyltransferase
MGRFWAVGVGPGDPGLVTLKAVEILRRVHVIYHAGRQEDSGRALEIVRAHLRPDQSVRALLAEPMSVVSACDDQAPYRRGVEQILADCRRGLDVAFVTEGDPTLYSTAAYVWELLAKLDSSIRAEIVPGVSSITAAAARAGWPLAQRDEMLAVVPASYHAAGISSLLEQFPSVCLLKARAVLPELEPMLRQATPDRRALYVENLGTPREWMTQDLAEAAGRKEYFSLVLVRRQERAAHEPPTKQSPGKVWVVGLGPGAPELVTRNAHAVLRRADVVVGYEGYVKPLVSLDLRAELRSSPIGAESERAALALDLARAGRQVVLVSSGDAGVYGMASLLLETAEAMPDLDIEIVPGVTAATAAAALLGAPLGHDFACVSLSDLLTPWEIIERRLEAAGEADFVLALYNPLSPRRTWQLPRARDLLLRFRRPETPVGLVEKAYRAGSRVWQTTLGALGTDGVNMETLLIVGNSQTRVINGRIITPRGYGTVHEPRPSGSGKPGQHILRESFTRIEAELGPHSFPPWAFAVVRRMIHASADFDFAQTLRYSPNFDAAIRAALRARTPIVTDTEMVLLGIRSALADDMVLTCLLKHPEVPMVADSAGLTRSAAGIRLAARHYRTPILAIGNAPTALEEALRLIDVEGWRPAAIIGMPVGFVGVEEAKRRLLEQEHVPYLTCLGRKGGSAVTAAAVNALVELSESP